jgi:photosystem II stability/assembly factor-like uncharacterized protein
MKRFCLAACIAVVLVCLGAVVTAPAHAYVPDGNQGWFWQMPQPASTLYDVTFAGPSDVWAVGSVGEILHSADAGVTWSAQQSGTLADLASVSFGDAQHGWACGSSAVVTTSDAGSTWSTCTPIGLSRHLINVSFVDDLHGWLGSSAGYVYRTTDGGSSWSAVHVGTSKDYLAVDFVDATHGWARGLLTGDLWRTTNGGASWSLVHRFAQGTGSNFVDADHGWALSVSGGNEPISSVLETSDGGRQWKLVRQFPDQELGGLYAQSRSSCALIGSVLGSAATLPQSPQYVTTLATTTDGGTHWTTAHIGVSVSPEVVAGSGASLCAVGQGILTSANHGATWQAQSSGQLYWLQDGVALTSSDLWAVDQDGALLHSTDGATWSEQTSPLRWSQQLSALSFPDANDGWLVGATNSIAESPSGVIFHTDDGGTTWSPQSSVLAGELTGVQFADANDGWAISDMPFGFGSGANAAIERTTDGGAAWAAEQVPNNPGLTAISFTDDTTGWVGGNYSTNSGATVAVICKTIDGGQSWSGETLPAGVQNVTALQFLDANDGWAVAQGPTTDVVLQTTNGGSTWTTVSSLPAAAYPTCVHFLNASQGWVGGDGVWATSNGAQSWAKVAGGDSNAIAASDAGHVWAFGDGILSTVNGPSGDVAPPQTLDNADGNWHRTSVTITLSANDTGGSGVQTTQYSADGGAAWQTGTSILVPAPTNHANDGLHTFLYRSTDTAGNIEATEICGIGIDTLGPACGAPKEPIAGTGKSAIVRFTASDATSGVARAAIRIESRSGRVLKTLVTHSGNWSGSPTPYFWLRFTCKLKPGLYRVVVEATDRAGNRQVTVGRSWLRVRKSASKARAPYWPSGLPDTSQQGDSPRRAGVLLSKGWAFGSIGNAPARGR